MTVFQPTSRRTRRTAVVVVVLGASPLTLGACGSSSPGTSRRPRAR